MGRVEALEARIGELQGELGDVLDEYVEVQERLRLLEAVTDCDGERAGERALAELPERLRRAAEAASAAEVTRSPDDEDAAGRAVTAASQAEVAAAVERIEELDHEAAGEDAAATDGDSDADDEAPETGGDDGLGDIIIG